MEPSGTFGGFSVELRRLISLSSSGLLAGLARVIAQLSKRATLFVIRNLLNDLNRVKQFNGLNVLNFQLYQLRRGAGGASHRWKSNIDISSFIMKRFKDLIK